MLGVVMGVQTVHGGQFGDSCRISQSTAGDTFCKYYQHQHTKWGEIVAIKQITSTSGLLCPVDNTYFWVGSSQMVREAIMQMLTVPGREVGLLMKSWGSS